jgi:hypothetical protein
MDLTLQPILGNGINFSGMASFPPPDALPPGKMALAQNVRAAWGKPYVRLPLTTIWSPAGNAGWCCGGDEMSQDGSPSMFVALGYGPGISNANGTNFYKSTDGANTWTMMGYPNGAAHAGPYGLTTFNSEDTRVEFQVVTDRTWNSQTAYDLIVIQDGQSAPLIYGKSNSNTFSAGYGMSRVYQPPAPVAGSGMTFLTAFKNSWPINVSADITITNGTNISLAAASGQFYGTVQSGYVYGSGDSAMAEFSTVLNLTNTTGAGAGQLIVLANAWTEFAVTGAAPYGETYTQQILNQKKATTTSGSAAPPPIEVTSSTAHGLFSGQTVLIKGVVGNTAANGTWEVLVIDSTHFLLVNSVSNGTYTSGGNGYYSYDFFWPFAKIVLSDASSNNVTLYDPNQSFGTPIFLERPDNLSNTGLMQIAYPLPALAAGNSFDYSHVAAITISCAGIPPPVAFNFDFFEIASSGAFQGTTSFSAAYFSQDTRQIGPSTAYAPVVPGPTTVTGIAPFGGITILDDQRFWFDYTVNIPNPPTAALDAGIDSGLLYAQLPGQDQPFLCAQILLAAWNHSTYAWGYQSGTATSSVNGWTFFAQDLTWPALSGAALCLPTGVAMAMSSQRLFVGAGNTLWYSSAERPFQFYALQQSDPEGNLLPTSGSSLQLDGQTIQTLLVIGSLSGGNEGVGDPPVGAATIFAFTDRTVLMFSGWDAASLGRPSRMYDQGTYAPWSVAAFQTGWMFWASDGHVIRYGVNPQMPYAGMYPYAVSRLIVEDLLRAVPDVRIPFACAGVKDECYYLAISEAGTTERGSNQIALVWDYNESFRDQDNVWFEDVFPSAVAGCAKLFSYRSGARMHLMGFDAAGQTFEHVTYGQTEDAGSSGVAWSLVFPEVRGDGFMPVLVRRAVVHTDANMGTLTTLRTTQGRIAQATSSAVVTTSSGVPGTRCVRYDNVTAGGSVIPGVAAPGVTFQLSGTSPSGAVIHGVSVEVARQTVDGPDVS